METDRLRQFCVIVETGSLTKAAGLLHITHSGLSKSMKLLQDEAKCLLFKPSGRGLALTEAGLEIYQRAKEFLDHEERLFKLEKANLQTTLKIGTVEIFLSVLSEQLAGSRFENNSITLLDLDPGNIEQLIATKQLDFGITYVPFPMEHVEIIEVAKYHVGCYHLKGTFEKQDISQIPFVVPAQGLSSNPLGIQERDGWIESIYPRNKKYSVNLLSTAIELTLQGLCAIYIPDFVAKKINASRKTREILIEHPLPKVKQNIRKAFFIRHKHQAEDKRSKQLFRMVKEAIAG